MPKYVLEILIEGKDHASGPLGGVMGAVNGLGAAALNLSAVGLAGVGAALGASVATAKEFEHQLSAVQAVSLATDAEMQQLSETALRIGKDTAFGASEAASAMEMLAANGLEVSDILNGAADATVSLAAATGADMTTAANVATDAMAVFGIRADEMQSAINGISGVTVASKFDINDYALALAQGGGVARAVGVEFDDFNTAIAGISPLFASGSDAGTSFKVMLQRLVPASGPAADAMKELGLITADGANQFFDANDQLKGMAEISGILDQALAGLSEEQKNQALSTIFGTDAMRAAVGMAELGEAGFNELAGSIGNVDAAAQAATRLDNLSGDLEQLKGSLEVTGIQLGTAFIPLLRDLTQAASAFVDTHLVDRDWTPFVHGVTSVLDGLGAFVGYLAAVRQDGDYLNDWLTRLPAGVQPAVAGLGVLISTLQEEGLGGALRLAGERMQDLAARAGGEILSRLQDLGREGMDLLRERTGQLTERFPALQQAWEDLQPALEGVQRAVDPLITGFEEEGLGGAFKALPATIGPAILSLSDLRNELIDTALEGVAGLLEQLADSEGFRTFLSNAGLSDESIDSLSDTLDSGAGMLRQLGDMVVNVGRWFTSELLPPVVEAGRGFAEMLAPHLAWIADFGNEHLMPALRDIGGFLAANLPGAINVVAPLLTGLVDMGLALVELALAGIATTWDVYLKPAFSAMGEWLEKLTGGWENLAKGAGAIKDTMSDLATRMRDLASIKVRMPWGGDGGGDDQDDDQDDNQGDDSGLMGDANRDGRLSRAEWRALRERVGQPGGPASVEDWAKLRPPPGFARGVRNFAGGLAMVGEQGPELVQLPGGSDVFSNQDTRDLFGGGGGGGQTTIYQITIPLRVEGSVIAQQDLAEYLKPAIEAYVRNNGGYVSGSGL